MADNQEDADLKALLGEETPAKEERLHPVLTNAEVLEAHAEAAKRVEAATRKAALKKVIEDEEAKLLRAAGQVTGEGAKDEIVRIMIDLPEYSASITVNMKPYWHGQTYDVPRHVADSLREIMRNAWAHQEREIEGKDPAARYRSARNTSFNGRTGAVSNAPQVVA